jgi:hypothetical protein
MADRLTQLREFTKAAGGERVDRAAGVVKGVRVLGLTSANNRRYTEDAVKAAAPKYNGVGCFLGHASRRGEPRGVGERIGWLESVRFRPGVGLVGDLHVLRSHPMADLVFEAAERKPSGLMGLSHDADGETRRGRDGLEEVTSLRAVRSVDIVTDPASVSGFFEQRERRGMARGRTLREALRAAGLPPRLRRALERARGDMTLDDPMAAPDDGGGQGSAGAMGPGGDGSPCGQIRAAAQAALDEGDQNVHSPKYLKFLEKVVALCDQFDGAGADDEPPADAVPTEESRRRLQLLRGQGDPAAGFRRLAERRGQGDPAAGFRRLAERRGQQGPPANAGDRASAERLQYLRGG